jgi:CHAT domain-containing protein/tetratricopeptide (TPR) repeat protein
MHIRRVLLLLPLMGAAAGAAAPPSRDAAIYRALAEGDDGTADTLSTQWLAEKADTQSFEVRIDVLVQRAELSKAAGDALRHAIETSAPALIDRFDIQRQIEKGEKVAASDAAIQRLRDVSPTSAAAAELDDLVGCAGVPALSTDVILQHVQSAKAAWHAQHSPRGAFREYGTLLCEGRANARAGRESAAIDAFSAAAKLAAVTFGDDVALRLSADYQVASELEQLGRVREELELREDTLHRARRHYGDHHVQTAEAEAGVGACLQQIGDYAPSRAHYEAAEKILVDTDPRASNLRLRVLVNFANVLQEMGDEDAALQRYRDAYAIAEKPGAERTRAIILTNTGNTHFRLRHYEEAKKNYLQALALREAADGKSSPGLAFALEGLASTALMLRQYQTALGDFSRALALRESVAQKDHSQHVQMITLSFGIAMAKWGVGDIDGASSTAQDAADRAYTLIDGIAANLPERQRLGLREQLPPAAALVVTLAAQRGDRASIEAAWRVVMRERGLIARGQARRLAEARAQSDPTLRQAWQTWRDASTAVAQSWLKSDADENRLRTLREQAESAERDFWDRAGNGPTEAVPSPDALATALPEDAVLIAIAEGLPPDPAWPLIAGRTLLPDRWFAFRLDGKKNVSLTELGSIEAVSAQARAWYGALGNPHSDIADLDRRGSALVKTVFDPLHVFDAPRRVFVVPEGELFRINPAALPVRGGYAVERGIQVHTLANESELLTPAASQVARIVLAGAPTFKGASAGAGSRQLCQRAGEEGFHALPNASRELESLQKLLQGEGRSVQMLTGASATKHNVLAALPGAEAIHLATHGFSLDATCAGEPDSRSIVIASDERPSPEAQTMTLSGLAFAGASAANRIDPSGILSAAEFASLDLSHAGWVVLSACDSGLGPIGRSEGVFGMRRAIRMAGARTVVMSLWEVDDASTADLMQALYRARFAEHADVPAAMATAMKETLAHRRASGASTHPYYWAAFISEGGWR